MVDLLKSRAKRNGRSLQGEVRMILEGSAGAPNLSVLEEIDAFRQSFGRKFSSSVSLVREGRAR